MTEGEKMVWAAVYARHYTDEHNQAAPFSPKKYADKAAVAIENAWLAVQLAREARQDIIEICGHGDVLNMLDEILEE